MTLTKKITAAVLGAAVLAALLVPRHAVPPQEEPEEALPVRTAQDDPYIKIGLYASLTGSASLLGQMGQQGCRLAVEQINAAGGINGRQIRLIEYDDQTDPEQAVQIVRKLITEDRVDAIIGSHTSGNIIRTAPLTEQAHVLQVGLGTSYLWTNAGYRYLFRATGNSLNYDEALYSAIQSSGAQRIAVYYCNTEYAAAGAKAVISRVRNNGDMKLVWNRSNNITQTDFRYDLSDMLATEPDAVVLYATSENAGIQLRQLRENLGYQGPVYGPEAFANSSVRIEAGDSMTDLVFACSNVLPDSPIQAASALERSFLESYIKTYGTMPTAETAYRGYDAVMLLAEAFTNSVSLESEDLRRSMLAITGHTGISGIYNFSGASGDGLHSCLLVTMPDPSTMERASYSPGTGSSG